MIVSKRVYYPLVLFFYHSKLLSSEQLTQIPKTTKNYWNTTSHVDMFGYEWVSSFYSEYDNFNLIQKHKIIFKSARLCCKVFDVFSVLCTNIKAYHKIFKNNAGIIINTIDYLAQEIRLDKACRLFNITTQKFYRFKNKVKCTASVLNLCYKTHPHQLTIAECSQIKEAVNDATNERKTFVSIWYKLMRDGKLYCSASTFYKYANLVSERVAKIKFEKPKMSLKATRIFEFIHVDTTLLPTLKDGTIRAVIIKDNYSKKVLHKGIVDSGDSKWIVLLLKEMFAMYGLENYNRLITLVSDGGSENKGDVTQWFNTFDKDSIAKQIAKTKEFKFTNNEIESTFNIFKNEFLQGKEIIDKEHAKRELDNFANYNDKQRYPIALYGCTPQEVFEGAIIDKHRFKENIRQARKNRYGKNKAGRFCDVCTPS